MVTRSLSVILTRTLLGLLFLLGGGGMNRASAQVTSRDVNPDDLPAEVIGSSYASMLVESPEGVSTSNATRQAATCTPATKSMLKIAGSKVVGGTATLNVPAGACPVEVSFSTYMLPQGLIRPFEAQVLYRNRTATYGPGTHTITLDLPACAWQADLYLGPVVPQLIPNVGHPTNVIFAWAYMQNTSRACATGSLGDFIWYDTNGDGLQDVGEGGVSGATVTLFDGNSVQRSQTTTSSAGLYLFQNLLPGDYYVVVSGYPAQYYVTKPNEGLSNAADSDLDASGRSETVTLAVGQHYRDLDGGITVAPVRPILDKIYAQCDGTYRAEFGYLNENPMAITIPVGADNRITPVSSNGGQTTVFQPGRVMVDFSVVWDGTGNIVWSLRGPNGQNRTATAGVDGARNAGLLREEVCACRAPEAPSYQGGYVLNAAQTRAFVELEVPEGATQVRFYETSNLNIGSPETSAESMTPLSGASRAGNTFTFTSAPTSLFFPITTAGSGTKVSFFVEVTDACGQVVDVDPSFTLAATAEGGAAWALHQNAPNPFAGETAVTFSLAEGASVQLIVYDVVGREVARLADGFMEAGTHTVRMSGQALPAGQYVYRLRAGEQALQRMMTLTR